MKWLVSYILLVTCTAHAQQVQPDTMRTIILSEIIVRSSLEEKDTLQNFFRANKSATTEDILSRLQSVYLIRRGNYGQEPMLRGMTGGQISMTIDGMKMFGACTDKMDPVSIYVEPQNLKGINAQAGSDGSRLGSTVGGSIDMKLASPQLSREKWAGVVGTGYQSAWKGMNTYANANYSSGRSAYRLSLNYRKANEYKAGGGTIVPFSQYNKVNLSASGKWALRQDTIEAQVLLDNGWNIGFPALPMDVGSAKARIYSISFLRYRCHELLETLQTKIYFNTVAHIMDDSHRTAVALHMDMPGQSSTAGIFTEGNLKSFGKHRVSFRADYYRNHVLAEMTMYPEGEAAMYMQTWPSSSRSVSGFFANDFFRISNKTNLVVNARMDISKTRLEQGVGRQQLEVFYPSVSLASNRLAKTVNVKISQFLRPDLIADIHAGYGERLPTLSESFGFYLFNRNDGYDYIGNPKLKNEKSISADVGLSYFRPRFQLTINGFYKYMPEYIFSFYQTDLSPMTPGANGVKMYDNIESAFIIGNEISVLASISQTFQWIGTVKYVKAADYLNNPLPLIPPAVTLNSLRLNLQKWNVQAESEIGLAQNRVNQQFGEDTTPAYSIINLRGGYSFKQQGKRVNINAGIENLFDKKYHNHLDWGNVPRPGRNFNLSMEIRF